MSEPLWKRQAPGPPEWPPAPDDYEAGAQISPETMEAEAKDALRHASPPDRVRALGDLAFLARRFQTWREPTRAEAEAADRKADAPACPCPGAVHDRICLGCGVRRCPACAPQAGGAPCPSCSSPVWADGEIRTPPRRNPAFKGW